MRAFVIESVSASEGDTKTTIGGLKHDVAKPVPGNGEALVRVLRAGVCNTDLELLAGCVRSDTIILFLYCTLVLQGEEWLFSDLFALAGVGFWVFTSTATVLLR